MSGWQVEVGRVLRDVPGLTAEEDDAIITALAPVVEAEVRRGQAEALREAASRISPGHFVGPGRLEDRADAIEAGGPR